MSHLSWQDEDGGYAFGVDAILDMDLDQMDRYIRMAYKMRKARSDAIKSANRQASTRRKK